MENREGYLKVPVDCDGVPIMPWDELVFTERARKSFGGDSEPHIVIAVSEYMCIDFNKITLKPRDMQHVAARFEIDHNFYSDCTTQDDVLDKFSVGMTSLYDSYADLNDWLVEHVFTFPYSEDSPWCSRGWFTYSNCLNDNETAMTEEAISALTYVDTNGNSHYYHFEREEHGERRVTNLDDFGDFDESLSDYAIERQINTYGALFTDYAEEVGNLLDWGIDYMRTLPDYEDED